MVHWLEYGGIRCMPDREKEQLEELRQYLRKYPEAKAEGYWKTTGDMFARFVRLECNQSYDDLDMDVNSGFDKSLRRHTRKPSNIEYSETATQEIYEGVIPEPTALNISGKTANEGIFVGGDKGLNEDNLTAKITQDTREWDHYVKGRINDNIKFYAKVFDEGSVHGIAKGRVSKLDIRKDGVIITNYDRGWDVRPVNPEHLTIYEAVMRKLNGLSKEYAVDDSEQKTIKHNEYPEKMKLVYVVSPVRGNIEDNLKKANRYCEYVAGCGHIPIAPHLAWQGFLPENPENREKALAMGLKLIDYCSEVWVCGDEISQGMQSEIAAAEKLKKPIMYVLQERIDENLKIRQSLEPLGITDCVPGSDKEDYGNKILVLNPEALISNCRNAQNSLWVAYNGFGCTYGARGQAVFAKNLFDGRESQWERADFLGAVKPESLQKWLDDMPVKNETAHTYAREAEQEQTYDIEL